MNYNLNSGYGQLLAMQIAAAVGPTFGKIHVVVNASDVQGTKDMVKEAFVPDPDGVIRFYATLEAAYSAVTSNSGEVILLAGHNTHTIANGIAWSKNRINVIGMDGGGRLVQQGAKVQSTDAAADAYVIKVTGVRNSFRNIKFIQVDTNAAALHVLEEGGEGNLYDHCSFTFGVVDNLDQTNAYEVLAGSDSATYTNCYFGTETLLTSAARAVFAIDQVTTSQEFKSNILRKCTFLISSSSSTACLVKVVANTDVLFTNLFDDCTFMASIDSAGGAALAQAVISAASLVKGTLYFANPRVFGCTNFSIATSGANAGVRVIGPVVTPEAATDLVAVQPVAT